MGIAEFANGERAKIERLEKREKAFKLGQAAVAAAEQKGLSEIVKGPDSWSQASEWTQTPFVPSASLNQDVAVRKKRDSSINYLYLVVKIDESNTGIYARVPEQSTRTRKTIMYGEPEEDLAAADEQVVSALSEIAQEMGLDPTSPEFAVKPATIPERPF